MQRQSAFPFSSEAKTYPDPFKAFWDAYPRKVAKEAACRAFRKLNPTPEMLHVILTSIARQRLQPSWQEEKFIPHASTWLNGKRWEDEEEKETPKPGAPGYQVTDVDKVIGAFRKAKKIPAEDKAWVTTMWEKQKPEASRLLAYFGDWRRAVDCIAYTAEKCAGWAWGWGAVHSRAAEFKNNAV